MTDLPSRVVSLFGPLDLPNGKGGFHSSNRNAFKQALYQTFLGAAEGVITPYLFYDPPETGRYESPWGTIEDIPFGARAWDAHIKESTQETSVENRYEFADGDIKVLEHAINNGLIQKLPKYTSFYSYGPGDLIAVRGKDCRLIKGIIENGSIQLTNYNAIDINDRYAHEAAREIHKEFNVESRAIQGDFMEGTLQLGNKDGTSLIAVFGGPFANAQNKRKAAEYLGKLTRQHGMGTQIVMTVDTESDVEKLMASYAPTRSFEAFVLSSFPRAVHEGIILNPNYNVFDHWRMVRTYDPSTKAMKLSAECKKEHLLETEDGKFSFKVGHTMTNILSNKWCKDDLKYILRAAGFSDEKFYETKGNSKKILTAKSIREPNLDLVS